MTSSQTAGPVPPFGAGSFGAGAEFQTGGFQGAGFKDARFPQDDPLGLRAQAAQAMAGSTPEQVMARLELLAHILDTAIVLPGNRRIGLDAIVGLIPVIGDVVTTAISSYIVWEARRLGAPRWLIARMAANVAIDGVVGAVPLVGDLFDAAFKANRRNVVLLRRHLERSGSLKPSVIDVTATRID
ncbi:MULTISPECIES: DUF4112 domain-containing protein [Methylobacterium]|jgi:hypothetical protein|uniref:DUF4112 domain-containing protein n=2 Tax=Methylobacterium TaxID=407 RepID=A0A0C6FK23_9HYPH|nr:MULTISPECIES: DUF4112 domain-containing protein [Methylobacterium]MBZ6411537.1 DUF4112 domain-containing protein [Methylobacterium sp.]BAQ45479.1 hypothetical protein Maq22A_c11070 [Methylobacterium aquaticum]SFE63479.1 protein of unknown function [Methylobacterium sp. yr596]